MKWKLPVVATLLFLITAIYRVNAETPLVYGTGFYTTILNGQTLDFQSDYTFTLSVESGTLNGSNCEVALYARKGTFSFYANDSATLHASVNREDPCGLSTVGAILSGGSNNWTLTIPVDTQITISWFYRLPSYIDQYFYVAMGLGGVFLMIFSPTWCVWKIKKSGMEVSTFERFGYAMLLFLVGFGLVVVWLWG